MRGLTHLIALSGDLPACGHVYVRESQGKTYGNSFSGCSRFRGQELNTFAYNNKYADILT